MHVWAFAVDLYRLDGDMEMYVGPDRAGNLLEVSVFAWHGLAAIVHAQPARPKFLR